MTQSKATLNVAPEDPSRDERQVLGALEAVSGQFYHFERECCDCAIPVPTKVAEAYALVRQAVADMKGL